MDDVSNIERNSSSSDITIKDNLSLCAVTSGTSIVNECGSVSVESNTNAMDIYLRKYQLDVTLLPNKKVKLCDLKYNAAATSVGVSAAMLRSSFQTTSLSRAAATPLLSATLHADNPAIGCLTTSGSQIPTSSINMSNLQGDAENTINPEQTKDLDKSVVEAPFSNDERDDADDYNEEEEDDYYNYEEEEDEYSYLDDEDDDDEDDGNDEAEEDDNDDDDDEHDEEDEEDENSSGFENEDKQKTTPSSDAIEEARTATTLASGETASGPSGVGSSASMETDTATDAQLQRAFKSTRKKREPSLKLQQKLSSDDLELVVSCVRSRQADVYIADVQKANYTDKILRVRLTVDAALSAATESSPSAPPQQPLLSNGSAECLLKKSMFPKELATLFDAFVAALCVQDWLVDAATGHTRATLRCRVIACGYRSCSEADMTRHIKRHLAQDGYTCAVCAHQFASMTNLQRHVRVHTQDGGAADKAAQCPHCAYRAATLTHVKRHMAHKHLERALPCPHCSFMGATNAELKIHMARKHLELTGKNPLFLPKYLRKDYLCAVCHGQYNDFKEYQTHMYEHTSSSNRFQCTECPYNCKNFSKLKRHMLYHTGSRNFECKLCGNRFFQMEHLKRHMQSIHNMVGDAAVANSTCNNVNSSSISHTSSSSNSSHSSSCSLLAPLGGRLKCGTSRSFATSVVRFRRKKQPSATAASTISTTAAAAGSSRVKCTYRCPHCSFTSASLWRLNTHAIKCVSNGGISSSGGGAPMHTDIDDEDEVATCAFCAFKSDRTTLRRHLVERHSTEMSARMASDTSSSRAEHTGPLLISLRDNSIIAISGVTVPLSSQPLPPPSSSVPVSPASGSGQHQQIRDFINSSSHFNRRHIAMSSRQLPPEPVRINPLLLKQQSGPMRSSSGVVKQPPPPVLASTIQQQPQQTTALTANVCDTNKNSFSSSQRANQSQLLLLDCTAAGSTNTSHHQHHNHHQHNHQQHSLPSR